MDMWPFDSRRHRADKCLAAGKVEKAIALYVKDGAWDVLAGVYEKQGDMKAAAESAQKAGQAAEDRSRARRFL